MTSNAPTYNLKGKEIVTITNSILSSRPPHLHYAGIVTRQTKTLLFTNKNEKIKIKSTWSIDPNAVKTAKLQHEEALQRQKQREEEAAKRKADPKLVLVDRFSTGMDNWDNLSLDQLQQIKKWLDND